MRVMRFISSDEENKTDVPGYTQSRIIKDLEEGIANGQVSMVYKTEQEFGRDMYSVHIREQKLNPKTGKLEWHDFGKLCIVVDQNKYGANANKKKLDQFAKRFGKVTFVNKKKLGQIGKMVLAGTLTTALTLGTIAAIVEMYDNEIEQRVQQQNEFYQDENGFDVRNLYGGYEEDGFYFNPNGQIYWMTSGINGSTQYSPVTQEEYESILESRKVEILKEKQKFGVELTEEEQELLARYEKGMSR